MVELLELKAEWIVLLNSWLVVLHFVVRVPEIPSKFSTVPRSIIIASYRTSHARWLAQMLQIRSLVGSRSLNGFVPDILE